jgi:hypothetical protein
LLRLARSAMEGNSHDAPSRPATRA